jgi:putative membrane protein
MSDARSYLSQAEREQVEAAVAEAEQQTSAELVCAVATESGRYDRAEGAWGLIGAVLTLMLANTVLISAPAQGASWTIDRGLGLAGQVAAVVIGFVAGNLLASYFHPLRRLLVSNRELAAETERAAWAVFAQRRMRSTRQQGGLLIYVSLFERRVVILADDGILGPLGQVFLDQLRDEAVAHLRAGRRLATFVDTVRLAASRLAEPLPVETDDTNELHNQLVCIHPRP